MNSRNPQPDSENNQKAALICSTCDRSAPMGDNWRRKHNVDRTEIKCPNCGSVVVDQPTFDPDETQRTVSAC